MGVALLVDVAMVGIATTVVVVVVTPALVAMADETVGVTAPVTKEQQVNSKHVCVTKQQLTIITS